jgi:phosphopantothenoylcysteine decarboxylase / phosphopantothenate---cysteine ligase
VLRRLTSESANGRVVVAFGAEHGEAGLERKRGMLDSKNVDLVVYNDVGRDDIGFEAPDNEVTLITRAGDRHVAKASKARVAGAVLDEVSRLLEAKSER